MPNGCSGNFWQDYNFRLASNPKRGIRRRACGYNQYDYENLCSNECHVSLDKDKEDKLEINVTHAPDKPN